MRRLLWKELRSSAWVLVFALVVAVFIICAGDPLFYRGEASGMQVVLLIIPFLLLGLRAYSEELSGDRVRFLYSLPIKWWQVWLAKLLTGVLASLAVSIFAAALYLLMLPLQYRPFIHETLLSGTALLAAECLISYCIGFVMSVLMPGLALSFAAMIGVFTGIGVASFWVSRLGDYTKNSNLERFPDSMSVYTAGIIIFAFFLAALLSAKRLARISTRRRLLLWASCPVVASVLIIILTCFGIGVHNRAPGWDTCLGLSPNGRWVVLAKDTSFEGIRNFKIMDTDTGRSLPMWTDVHATGYAWSPDSTRFAYVNRDGLLRMVRINAASVKTLVNLRCGMKGKNPYAAISNLHVSWSPDGTRVGILRAAAAAPETDEKLPIIDVVEVRTGIIQRYVARETLEPKRMKTAIGAPMSEYGADSIFWPPDWMVRAANLQKSE